MGIVSQVLRDSARNQQCTLRFTGICNHDPATTILAHLPSEVKGTATKSDDWNACFACAACHDALDNRRMIGVHVAEYCLNALQRTQKIWRDMGLITIAGDTEKPRKPSSKIVPRRSMVQS